MLATFMMQLAAGCLLAAGLSRFQETSWKYLRLMAVVCAAAMAIALALALREAGFEPARWALATGGAAMALNLVWLVINSSQREGVRTSQRTAALAAGAAAMAAAVALAISGDALVQGSEPASGGSLAATGAATVLGALLIGFGTAAMLLGHRYLTDTGMTIAPLKRLTHLYLAALAVRIVWVAGAGAVYGLATGRVPGEAIWLWLMVSVRVGCGLAVTAVFGWMAWDCVKRRATQSATALFYLSMVFIFLGELTAQYLARSERLAL